MSDPKPSRWATIPFRVVAMLVFLAAVLLVASLSADLYRTLWPAKSNPYVVLVQVDAAGNVVPQTAGTCTR